MGKNSTYHIHLLEPPVNVDQTRTWTAKHQAKARLRVDCFNAALLPSTNVSLCNNIARLFWVELGCARGCESNSTPHSDPIAGDSLRTDKDHPSANHRLETYFNVP